MEIFELNREGNVRRIETLPSGARLSCAFGCFDGVHIGHRALLDAAVKRAESDGSFAAVWTFSEPVSRPWLFSVEERLSLCGAAGIRYALCESFGEVRGLSPREFVERLCKRVEISHAVCGYNFRFGKDRAGDSESLREELTRCSGTAARAGAENAVTVIGAVVALGDTVSSTRIRQLLLDGRTEDAAVLLGRAYSMKGTVLSGKQIGRTVALPTVNLRFSENQIVPKRGVYYTVCKIGGVSHRAVTNIGFRPTVNGDENDVNCESHIIDFNSTVYGETAEVCFYRYARSEHRFPDVSALAAQIRADIDGANAYFDSVGV